MNAVCGESRTYGVDQAKSTRIARDSEVPNVDGEKSTVTEVTYAVYEEAYSGYKATANFEVKDREDKPVKDIKKDDVKVEVKVADKWEVVEITNFKFAVDEEGKELEGKYVIEFVEEAFEGIKKEDIKIYVKGVELKGK